jgi:hypothetical protein
MLQALPGTGLSKRLAAAGRLPDEQSAGAEGGDINQTSLMNFIPTRPITEIASEYVDGFWELYDPKRYLDRVFRHFMMLKEAKFPRKPKPRGSRKPSWPNIRALLIIVFRQGMLRETRWQFWQQLYRMWRLNPGGITSYLSTCAQFEHLLEYRQRVRTMIAQQLNANLALFNRTAEPAPQQVRVSLNVRSASQTLPSAPQAS